MKINYNELVDFIYEVTNIDRIRHNVAIYVLVELRQPSLKFLINNDNGIGFVMAFDSSRFRQIIVDTIVRDCGVSAMNEPNIHAHIHGVTPPHNTTGAPDFIDRDNNFFASTSDSNQISDSVAICTSTQYPQMSKDEQGLYDIGLAHDADFPEAEHCNTDGGDDDDDDDDDNDHVVRTPIDCTNSNIPDRDHRTGSNNYPDLNFDELQFAYNPLQPHWCVPGVVHYCFEMVTTAISTDEIATIYKGTIFEDKTSLKFAFFQICLEK